MIGVATEGSRDLLIGSRLGHEIFPSKELTPSVSGAHDPRRVFSAIIPEKYYVEKILDYISIKDINLNF